MTHKDARAGITPIFYELSREDILNFDKLYIFEVHRNLSNETTILLQENGFVAQERIESARITVYTRTVN